MFVLKLLTVLPTVILTLPSIRHMMRQMEAAKVRVHTRQQAPSATTRLRQDPRTGIYYPEN